MMPGKALVRFQFLEMMLRFIIAKYISSKCVHYLISVGEKMCEKESDAIVKFTGEVLQPLSLCAATL